MGAYATASGYQSTAMGYYTTASGWRSTAMGQDSVASGDFSTAMGVSTSAVSGYETAIGYYNTEYTPSSPDDWDDTDRLFVIGNGDHVSRSDAMVVLKNGKVGIGTSTPDDTLDVQGSVRINQNDIFFREGIDSNHGLGWYGVGKSFASIDVDGPALYGFSGGVLGTTNGGQQAVVHWQPWNLDIYGYTRFHVLSGGSTSACLDTNNTLSTCSSDERLKKDVVTLSEGMDVLDILSQLRGVFFSWDTDNEKVAHAGDNRDMGMIAQEVEPLLPEIVHTDPDGYKSMDYPKLTAFLVEVNKAQQEEISAQQEEIRNLKDETSSLKRVIGEMNARLAALEGQ